MNRTKGRVGGSLPSLDWVVAVSKRAELLGVVAGVAHLTRTRDHVSPDLTQQLTRHIQCTRP